MAQDFYNPDDQYDLDPATGQYTKKTPTVAQVDATVPAAPVAGAHDDYLNNWYNSKFQRGPNENERTTDSVTIDKYGREAFESDFQKRLGNGSGAPTAGSAPALAPNYANMSVTDQWNAAPAVQMPDWYGGWFNDIRNKLSTERAATKEQGDSLFTKLMEKINQSKTVDRNDPVIRAQADAFSANTERSRRAYLAQMAEQGGAFGNIQGEARLASERAGVANAGNEAQLMANEVQQRRDEITQALSGALGYVSAAQARQLQEEMGVLDQVVKQMSIGLQDRALTNDMSRAYMTNDLGLRSLGLQDWDRQMYYDLLQRGVIGG